MRPRRDWLAGVVVGAGAGFLLVYGPVFGLALIGAFGIPALVNRSAAAIGGMAIGASSTVLLMLTLANLNCAGRLGPVDGACTPPDLTAWFGFGVAAEVIGVLVTMIAIAPARRR